jgi:fumarate reductase subunit D
MQNEAYKLTGFTAVISAAGFMLRWLQNMRIIDTETGLATPHAAINGVVTALIVIVALVLLGFMIYFGRYESPAEPEKALSGKTFLYTLMGMIPVFLLLVSGVIQLFQANETVWGEGNVGLHRICAIATVAAALGLGVVIQGASKPERATARRVGMAVLILFDCVWLITIYKSAAADPVVWRYAVEVMGIAAAAVAAYYVAGFYYDEPNSRTALYFCELGAFLCVMSAMDEHTLADGIILVAQALLLLTWGYVIVENFQPKTQKPEAEQPEETT